MDDAVDVDMGSRTIKGIGGLFKIKCKGTLSNYFVIAVVGKFSFIFLLD